MLIRRTAGVVAGLAAGLTMVTATAGAPLALASPAGNPAAGGSALASEMQAAWRITEGRGVLIAMIGNGVASVPGLTGKVVDGPDYARLRDPSMVDSTVIASALAASGSTSAGAFGQIGRAPEARILAIRIEGQGTEPGAAKYLRDGVWQANEAAAIRYAVRRGAEVIAIQVSGYTDTPGLESAVADAVARGSVIVVSPTAYGSEPNEPMYPGSLPGVISVGFTVLTGQTAPPRRAYRLPVNDSMLLTAPANVLPVNGPGASPYQIFNQFSSLAWTAGTVALIKSAYPRLGSALIERALALSAKDGPAAGYSDTVGFGLINPLGALQEAARLVGLRTTAAAGQGVVPASGQLAARPEAGMIKAVHRSPAALELGGGLMAAGLVLLGLALIVGLRRRRRGSVATAG